ncbi:hypothetical protein GCM10020254_54920 [Streptomyces goshikiensis]
MVWSGSFVATRGMADSVPPVQAVFWRWVIAAVAVSPFAARQAWRQRALIRRHLGYTALATLFGVALYNTLVHQAGLTTSASNMGMIMAASPVVMALYSRVGGERLGARRTFGMLLAALGVLLLVGHGSPVPDFAAGDLWMFAAALSFATYSALLRRKPAELGGLAFLLTTFVLGTLMLAPAYAVSVTLQGGFALTPGTGGSAPLRRRHVLRRRLLRLEQGRLRHRRRPRRRRLLPPAGLRRRPRPPAPRRAHRPGRTRLHGAHPRRREPGCPPVGSVP